MGKRMKVPQSEIDHFLSIPWISPQLRDPSFRIISMSRTLTQPGSGHSLMASTWNTSSTITHLVSLYRPPRSQTSHSHNNLDGGTGGTDGGNGSGDSDEGSGKGDIDGGDQTGEVRRFYTFGPGLNAHPNLLHGGVIATILDSTMGNVIGCQMPSSGATFTVSLTVDYKAPVKTPGTVVVRSWIERAEGRKVWVHGVVEGEGGVVHARGRGLWLRAKAKI